MPLCPARSFRGTIDEQIVDLHKDIKSGKLVMANGRLPWEELFEDAIDAAEAHPASRIMTAGLDLFRDDVMADPACRALYFNDAGERMQAGDILRQPALAESLRKIKAGRSAAYYEGDIAKSIGDYALANGGLLGPDQFAGYEPEWVEPLSNQTSRISSIFS